MPGSSDGTTALRGPVVAVLVTLLIVGCGRLPELPLRATTFSVGEAAVRDALSEDAVERAVERGRAFERRFPGPVADGLLGEALWRSGRLNEAEGFLRRAARAGDRRGQLGMARVAVSRARWDQAREWATRAAAGRHSAVLLLTIARATGDADAAVEAATALVEASESEADGVAVLARRIVEGAGPGSWEGAPGVAPLERSEADGWVVAARFDGRDVRLRLALDGHRSWIRPLQRGQRRAEGEDSELAVAVGDLVVGSVRMPRAFLATRDGAVAEGGGPPDVDGELAPDLLVDLRWSLDPNSRTLAVAPHRGEGWDAAAGGTAADRALQFPGRERTQWLSVRVLREGLEVQWLLMPRIEAKVTPATVAWSRQSIIDDDVVTELGRTPDGSRTTLEARLGDWWPWVRWEVADLSGLAAGGRVAPRLSLGGQTLSGWRLLWDPGLSQLGLVPEEADLAGLQ